METNQLSVESNEIVKSEVKSVSLSSLDIARLNSLSLSEIENYGSEVQSEISESVSSILKGTRCIDIGKTGECLAEVAHTSNHLTKKLSGFSALRPVLSVSKWLGKYDNIEHRIDMLHESVKGESERLSNVLNSLYDGAKYLKQKGEEFEHIVGELGSYIEYLDSHPEDADDGLRLQAAVNRHKNVLSMLGVVRQEYVKTILIIQENKEVSAQLDYTATNILPMFDLQLMNVIGAKANTEALKLKKSLVNTANKLVIDNAKQIKETAKELVDGRKEELFKAETLEQANKILQEAVTLVMDSAKVEVSENRKAVERLQNSVNEIDNLSIVRFAEVKDTE